MMSIQSTLNYNKVPDFSRDICDTIEEIKFSIEKLQCGSGEC